VGVFLNMEEAFDYIDHGILLVKVELYGITDRVYSFVKSYLENRYQIVSVSNDSSNENAFSSGGR